MPTIFHDIPQDAGTIAGVRKGCTERGFAKTCRKRPCRRARRCRAPWQAEEPGAPVLPPCLALRREMQAAAIGHAEAALADLRLIVATARALPDPSYAADFDEFDEAAARRMPPAPWEK
jgi:hypothetical protein